MPPQLQMPEIHTLPPEGLVLRGEVETVRRTTQSRAHWVYLALAIFVALVAMLTIARTYLLRHAAHGDHSWLDDLYILLIAGWVTLLVTQVSLVFQRQTPTHKKLGLIGVGYAL